MEDNNTYKVVSNHETQYSIWPAHREIPAGWSDTGTSGNKKQCLAYVEDVWSDMRPLSLKKHMDSATEGEIESSAEHPTGKFVHHLFEEQVRRQPDAVAVIFEDQQINYAELNRRANQIAHYLRSLGVGPEIKIGLCTQRSIEMVVGVMGILKSGGVYVPLDPAYPRKRLQSVIQKAQIRFLLTQECLLQRFETFSGQRLVMDKDWTLFSQQKNENIANTLSSANLSHIIFTSGSTGTPKGVMVAHASLFDNVLALPARLGITADDVYLHTASIAFTSSLRQLLVPLTVGAAVIIATAEQRTNPLALFDLIKRRDVTILDTVASLWETLVHALTFMDETHRSAILDSKLRMILSSGGELPSRIPQRWRSEFKNEAHLVNMYGQTETIGNILVYPIPANDDLDTKVVPLGPPLNNFDVYLMDEQLNLAGKGIGAELCIGGPNIARGYINQPGLTAEKFIPNPFTDKPGARLYRTGDLGSALSDTTIQFVGRRDFQVNIRGFRIEPGDIEAVIRKHPNVAETVVVARNNLNGDRRLAAYVVCGSDEKIKIEELRKLLEDSLPDYMVPTVFVMLDSLPRLPNGKLDRFSLPEPEQKRPKLGQAFVPARSDLQRYLASMWCEILGLDKVGIHDRFFEIGGTSILAARFVNRLQAEFGEFIYIVSVFEAPTVAQYADFLKNNYSHALAIKFPNEIDVTSRQLEGGDGVDSVTPIDHDTVKQMRKYIPPMRTQGDYEAAADAKNPAALFILSAPRSGATLLRIMLAGHPKLFVTGEMQLLGFHSLKERKSAFSATYEWWQEEIMRSIMAVMRCDAATANRRFKDYESNGLTTKEFYKILQERIEKRIITDGSSTYAFNLETLLKAEKDFRGARYIHFISHPKAMIRSFQSSQMAQRLYLYEHPFHSRQLGELLWIICQQNISKFLRDLPETRKFQLRLEDLMSQPQKTAEDLCRRFDLEFYQEMLKPMKDSGDNLRQATATGQRPGMNANDSSNYSRLLIADDRRRTEPAADGLSDLTWELAQKFGYQRITVQHPAQGDSYASQPSASLNNREALADQQRLHRMAFRMRKRREERQYDRQ